MLVEYFLRAGYYTTALQLAKHSEIEVSFSLIKWFMQLAKYLGAHLVCLVLIFFYYFFINIPHCSNVTEFVGGKDLFTHFKNIQGESEKTL